MKYVCLVHFRPDLFDDMAPEAQRDFQQRCLAYDEELRESGRLIVAEALDAPTTAVLVKVRNGNVSTTDGPFIETKEHLGGFILVEARDLNDAIRIASGIPLAQHGTIEVRPIYDVSGAAAE